MLALVLVLVGVGLTVAWFFGSDWRINKIAVQNNLGVPVEAIIGASALEGEHFQFVDLDGAAQHVTDLPGVEAARVTCHWLWHTDCVILVQPSRAMAVWQTPHGNVWNDYKGKLQLAKDTLPAALDVSVEGDSQGDVLVAGGALDPRLLRALNELLSAQPDVKHYTYSTAYGLVWTNENQQQIRLGWAEYDGAIGTKLKLARAIIKQLQARGTSASMVDVRFVEAPYYIK